MTELKSYLHERKRFTIVESDKLRLKVSDKHITLEVPAGFDYNKYEEYSLYIADVIQKHYKFYSQYTVTGYFQEYGINMSDNKGKYAPSFTYKELDLALQEKNKTKKLIIISLVAESESEFYFKLAEGLNYHYSTLEKFDEYLSKLEDKLFILLKSKNYCKYGSFFYNVNDFLTKHDIDSHKYENKVYVDENNWGTYLSFICSSLGIPYEIPKDD